MHSDDDKTEINTPSTVVMSNRTQPLADATEVSPDRAAAGSASVAPTTVLNLKTGDVLRDRFEVDRVLGEGGMGKVFLARDRRAESANPWVALKLLNGSFSEHPMAFAALRREAMQSRALNHPNIVNVYDFDRTDDHVYMVMEFMRGEPLDEFVKANPQGNPLEKVWPIIEGSGLGLSYVHQRNIIHADFKPSNVFLTEDNEVKVLDLGIARTLDENRPDSMTTRFDPDALGALTPQYASCEMFDGLTPAAQDDLYALGCVAYELLTGKHPYGYKSSVQARAERLEVTRPPGLKSRQWKALKSSLALVRAERQAHVSEFLEAMAPEGAQRNSWPWIVTSVAGVAAAMGVFVVNLTPSEADQIQTVLEQHPFQQARLASSQQATNWLEQGNYFLTAGSKAMESAELEKATALLAVGPSSSLVSFKLALTRSDDPQIRTQAAKSLLQISSVFSTAASNLDELDQEQGRPEPAKASTMASLVCYGLQASKAPDLLALYGKLTDSNPEQIRRTPACDELAISES